MKWSPKSISTLKKCTRKWVAKYIQRLPDPQHPKAAESHEGHVLLERMLREGPRANAEPESKVGKWARSLYPLAPVDAVPEISETFDLLGYTAGLRADWVTRDYAVIGDWKIIGRRAYALTSLADDIQARWYAHGAMQLFKRETIKAKWCYCEKPSSNVWTVEHTFERAETEKWMREHVLPWLTLGTLLRSLAPKPEVNQTPHDITACGGTGHFCSFLGACQFTKAAATTEQLIQIAKGHTSS